MRIEIRKLAEAGYWQAMKGLTLNKMQPLYNMPNVAEKLCKATSGSHRKFLRQIMTWWQMKLPRYIWSELDTYKIATTRSSGSTMHNIHKGVLTQSDFVRDIPDTWLWDLNRAIEQYQQGNIEVEDVKTLLPEGYLQESVYMCSYETLRTIILDRRTHKLPEWKFIIGKILSQVDYIDLLPGRNIND